MIVSSDRRTVPRAGINGWRANSVYKTGNPGGPQGSSLMTFFCVFQLTRQPSAVAVEYLFGTSTFGSTGWVIIGVNNRIEMGAANTVPALVRTATPTWSPADVGRPLIAVCTWNSGTASGWLNGIATLPITSGTGYTAFSGRTNIGVNGNTNDVTQNAVDYVIMECGMLNSFDISGSIASVDAQWKEDLQQGRYLTWPRNPTNGQDWYWSARDAVMGPLTRPSWQERLFGSGSDTMIRTGSPQAAQSVPRFAT